MGYHGETQGVRVTNASMVFTLLCIAADVNVKEITHIAGEDNERCDRLSRRGLNPTMSVSECGMDKEITFWLCHSGV
jgi:hypothetical protein